ncbi:MAG: 50S ribosomal protein L6 [Alphaproteobacteria bacterium]|nr:50S ribosomal protein L6 [Alphaproteobacteria bacterium]MDA7982982.1 50S ribosomal protein L6 [Alphaproteobacteria bacterium]MDA7983968.1 50S ribosomal protein L6 [Alphaproteobacteria bacterium]MDA7986962.1 50S ribosomal protein L6 [Alphaproteobacteria bacterium]MDA7988106.1 50S ribosomal protein L6 [Alphaproteobacteria bacterium]
MSRVGSRPIEIPSGVEVRLENGAVAAKGKAGEGRYTLPREVEVTIKDGVLTVTPRGDGKRARQLWGTTRANLARLINGSHQHFEKRLEIEGVGFRAAVRGKQVALQIGYSHEVVYDIPEGVTVKSSKPGELVISGADYQRVGQVAAQLRAFRVPDPYKAKGIRYEGEYIRRKEGKKK